MHKLKKNRKLNNGTRAGVKWEWLGYDALQREYRLTQDWMEGNFLHKFNEGLWFNRVSSWVMRNTKQPVPASCWRAHKLETWIEDVGHTRNSFLSDPGAPPVLVMQKELPCVLVSLSSALYAAGDHFAAKYMEEAIPASILVDNRMDFVINRMRGHPLRYDPKRLKKFDIMNDVFPY